MVKHGALLCSYAFLIFILAMSLLCKAIEKEDRKAYIVYLGSLPKNEFFSPFSSHIGILERVVQGTSAANVLMRSYGRSFNGFAAKVTEQEREKLANMKEVVSVFPSRTYQLHTTRSWDFMGFSQNITRNKTVESDVIVGVMDTGIYHESESFTDDGFGPPPKKWKGACAGGHNFSCNKKIIGARVYTSDENFARDVAGHGSHTASTAAGNVVKDVSFYGLAQGTARGAVPSGRIAVYKVCTDQGCSSDAILKAFDDGIADKVDILSVSLGPSSPFPLDADPVSIGAYHAMKNQILTVQSAGNSGPNAGSVSSVAPWIFTIAASTTDRKFITKAVLGNGTTLVGVSVNSFTPNASSYPLIYGKQASSQCSDFLAEYCLRGCLDPELVKGKIVMCEDFSGFSEADRAGAQGAILANALDDTAFVVSPASTALTKQDYSVATSYWNSTSNPRANVLKSEVIKDPTAPKVASFSSRGPNRIVPEILKPDVTGPGMDIIAAYSPKASVASPYDKRPVKYNVLSGTSMSCPHVSGVAAYVKEFHPDWSPAAIKSSIMTTAWPMTDTRTSPGEYAYGSGHLNPVRAINPGLVYETSEEDYIRLLCMIMDEDRVRLISGDNSTCTTGCNKGSPKDLNYPSMAANVKATNQSFTTEFHRRVKNVGLTNSTYKANITANSTVDIKVVPPVLSFKSLNEEKNFTVTVAGRGLSKGSHVSALLVWSDGTHTVGSPIIISGITA